MEPAIGHILIPLLGPETNTVTGKTPRISPEGKAQKSAPGGETPAPLPVCAFAGEGSLLLQCLRVWQAKGLPVSCVVSSDPKLHAIAQQEGIAVLPSLSDFAAALPGSPVDYLFSVVNHRIIAPAVLQHLRIGAINFHDGPLPRYAGLHATSWAILRQEKEYGITWHKVDEHIDTGDILLQKRVEIAPDDTALTLNAKCYEAALRGFSELVDLLREGKCRPIPQESSERSYFSVKEKPARGGIISWRQPAEAIHRLCRALDFGSYANPLSLPKVLEAGDLLIPVGLIPLDLPSRLAPGTIAAIGEEGIRVATATQDVLIAQVTTPEGERLSTAQLTERFGWKPGYRLPEPGDAYSAEIRNREAEVAPYQPYWVRKLERVQPTALPFASRLPLPHPGASFHAITGAWPADGDRNPLLLAEESIPGALCAALAIYLHRVTGTPDLFVGFSTNHLSGNARKHPVYFAPCVPMEVRIPAGAAFGAVFGEVARELKNVIAKQTYPRDLVARHPALRARRELSAGITYPVAVYLTDFLGQLPETPPGTLTLVIARKENRYAWLGDPRRLDAAAVQRIAEGFRTLIDSIVAGPQAPVTTLRLLSDTERQKIVSGWNQTERPYEASACMHELFERQVLKTPHATAVLCNGQALTYAELNRKANQLAHRLRRDGVGPDVLVGICTEKSLEMVIGVLGIQKAGGAYVPLAPLAPRDRMGIVLDDLQLPVLVTQPHLAGRFADYSFRVIALNPAGGDLDDEPRENPESGVTADNLAYIIYTSGSTGIPKGVVVKHRPAINLIEWVNRTFSVGPADRVLFVNSLGFDLSVYDIFGLLAAGGSVRVASAGELQDPQRMLQILHSEPITFWNSAPATLSQLVPFRSMVDTSGGSRLRLAFLSGDWIPLSMPGWIRDTFPGAEVVSLGGATEATVWSNFYRIGELDEQWVSIPYGKPIQNARYHILDAHLEPVPAGVAGDLYIGGDCLAEGYFRRPELNAQKFIPDPFSDRPGDRLYRTGDLARYFPDGNMEFLGRVDHQVKVRGYRIELGEIEAVLGTRPDIQEVLVVAGPDPAGGKRLIAYVVPKAGCAPATQDLRHYLKDKLPEYMIPAAFVWLGAFPLNASGKIDRKALPDPHAPRELAEKYVAPRTPFQTLLAQIWQQTLQLDKVGIEDNFFEIGGHSLLAGRVISHIHQITGRLLPLSALFAHPTVARLAALLNDDAHDQVWNTLVPIRKTGSRPPLYCIHPISGDVEYAYKLVPYLDDQQPVYGILAKGINGVDAPFETVEAAAEAYVAQLLSRHPGGPVHLAGYSYGGFVAYEMARQLTALGHRVENLILFDTYPNNVGRTYRHYGLQYVLLSLFHLLTSFRNIRDFFRNQYWRTIPRKAKLAAKLTASRVGLYQFDPAGFRNGSGADTSLRDQIRERLYVVLTKAVQAYRFKPYGGKVVFIRAMEGAARYLSQSDFGWKKNVSGGVAVHDIPGVGHFKIFENDCHVRAVAAAMNVHLNANPARQTKHDRQELTPVLPDGEAAG